MTATDTNYITPTEFRDYIKDKSDDNSDLVLTAIAAASRAVDAHCGWFFYQRTEAQFFSAAANHYDALWMLPLDDQSIATTSGLLVESEVTNDGTYPVSWTLGTDFILEPINQSRSGINGWPWTSLHAIGTRVWPIRFTPAQRDTVRVTATWGWAAVPDPVKQATKISAAMYYKLAEAPFGVAGWGAYGDIKVRDIPQVASLLAPYRRVGSQSLAVA